ncbi:MAG: hypothetical protein ACRC61_06585 [Aeromonas salmonicida]
MIERFGSGRRKIHDFGLKSGFSASIGHGIKGDAEEYQSGEPQLRMKVGDIVAGHMRRVTLAVRLVTHRGIGYPLF